MTIPVYNKNIYSKKSLLASEAIFKELRALGEVVYLSKHKLYATTSYDAVQKALANQAKAAGLWNLFLPLNYGHYSGGLTNVEYGILAEEMGKVGWASEIFNCSAPDTGNMEVFAHFGSEEQKKKYLEPMLAGEIRSAFLMTEPDVASSDARNVQTSIVKDGDEYVVNGRKWWSSNVRHPNCSFYIVMGKTDVTALQVFGGKGVSSDIPLAAMYGHWRAMRLADSPEEVHMYQLGRNLLKKARGRKEVDLQYFNS